MSETISPEMSGVSETLLLTLYLRAKESQRPDALIKDERAAALVEKIGAERIFDFGRLGSIPLSEENKLVLILRSQECDRYVRDFLGRWPQAMVVHIGCGLDTRFERVDNGQVEWYNLDLPHVIELRRKLIGGEGERYHLLGCSVFDDAWLEAVSVHRQRPFLFLAETVFVYFEEAQVRSLVFTLRDHFPGAELVFDAWTPFNVWLGNRWLSPTEIAGLFHWGIWRGQELESWGDGIHMLNKWGFFDQPKPRMARFRWMASICRLFKIPSSIYHFQLGKTVA